MTNARKLAHPRWRDQPGLLRRIFNDPARVLDDLAAEFGPVCGLGAGPARMAVVGDPRSLRELFAMQSDDFRWGHKFNVLGFVVGSESLIVSDGSDHERRRGAVKGAFTRRRLNGLIPMIVDQTDRAIDRLTDVPEGVPGVVDLYPVGRSIVLEIIVRALFGDRLAGRAGEIGELFQRPQAYLEAPMFKQLPHPFPRTARARARNDRRALEAIVDEQITHIRAGRGDDSPDVLSALVADERLSDAEIRDQVITLIGAGYDTTAASLAWMFWCVSLAPGLWARLRAEADHVIGVPGQTVQPDVAVLAGLELANRTMRETTRLHPAGVVSPREAAKDLVIAGTAVPKGTLILWSAHLAGRNPDAWSDPLRFDPDRFLDPTDEERDLAAMAWVPFGRGARNCVGFALAQMELTLILARMAQCLDITATQGALPPPVGMVVNRPLGGAPMRLAARETEGVPT